MQVYDWATFQADHFREVPQMKLYHHFTFSPGNVTLKVFLNSTRSTFIMLQDTTWIPNFLHPSSHQVFQVSDSGACTIKYESFVKIVLNTWCAHTPQYPHQSRKNMRSEITHQISHQSRMILAEQKHNQQNEYDVFGSVATQGTHR